MSERKRIQIIPAVDWEIVYLDKFHEDKPEEWGLNFEPLIGFALMNDGTIEPMSTSVAVDGLGPSDEGPPYGLCYRGGQVGTADGDFDTAAAWLEWAREQAKI